MNKNHGLPGPTIDESTVHISVQIFGSLRIRRGSTTLDAHQLGGPKPRQILEILVLRLGTPVSKRTLIELLWGGNPPPEALAALESHVSVLRRRLQPGAGKAGALRTATGGYLMDRSLVDLDLDRFDELHRRARSAPPTEAMPLLRRALDLASAPILADELVAPWAGEERATQIAIVQAVMNLAAETALGLSQLDEAVRWATQALAINPLDERSWTALVLALEQSDRHAESLNAYERCRRVLERELGCVPGPALRAAHLRVLRGTVDVDAGLSEILAALLTLQDHFASTRAAAAHPSETPSPLHHASDVIAKFLHRTVGAA